MRNANARHSVKLMTIPCNRRYTLPQPDWTWLAREFGLDSRLLRNRVHKLKQAYGMGGADLVIICLDDGLVYEAASEDEIGDIHTS